MDSGSWPEISTPEELLGLMGLDSDRSCSGDSPTPEETTVARGTWGCHWPGSASLSAASLRIGRLGLEGVVATCRHPSSSVLPASFLAVLTLPQPHSGLFHLPWP